MSPSRTIPLHDLYEQDETAWLDAMSQLAAKGLHTDMDWAHLSEYLADMAKRDRKEVNSRLVVLMRHLLKWEQQPEKRTRSWQGTIQHQRYELRNDLGESGTLHHHARSILLTTHAQARQEAATESGLAREVFRETCPWELEEMLREE